MGTVCVGRTHGIHAEPTTFGLKLAGYAFEAERNLRRLEGAVKQASVGALSGAVGTYAANGPELEAAVLERLGPRARGRLDAGGGARPARAVPERDRARRRRPRAVRHRDPPSPAHRGARGRGAVPRGPEGLVGDAAQAQPDRDASGSPASRACCAATRRPGSRTSRSGTSATSRTRPPSAWRCPTPRSCSTTRSRWRCGWPRAWRCTRTACARTSTSPAARSSRSGRCWRWSRAGLSRDDAYRIVQENAQHAWDTGTPFRELLDAGAPGPRPRRDLRPDGVYYARGGAGRPARQAG